MSSPRLDYRNSLYTKINQSFLSCLQLVQNAAARFLTSAKKREHITSILSTLHWLPVRFGIDFKVALFVYKALKGLAPPYIIELLSPYVTSGPLRSSNQSLLAVSRANLKLRGYRIAAPHLWNSLLLSIRSAPTADSCFFKDPLLQISI